MTTPPNQRVERDWEKFLVPEDFKAEIDKLDPELWAQQRVHYDWICTRANALIRQAIADAVTVYGQDEDSAGIKMNMPSDWYLEKNKYDNHTAKLICVKGIK